MQSFPDLPSIPIAAARMPPVLVPIIKEMCRNILLDCLVKGLMEEMAQILRGKCLYENSLKSLDSAQIHGAPAEFCIDWMLSLSPSNKKSISSGKRFRSVYTLLIC